jgi:hypothetical protein
MVKEIFGFDIKIDRRCVRPTFVVFWVGSHDDHLMDWRGCNFRRIKAKIYYPNCDVLAQPVFHDLWKAVEWATKNRPESAEGIGEHVSDNFRDWELGIVNDNIYASKEKADRFTRNLAEKWEDLKAGKTNLDRINYWSD